MKFHIVAIARADVSLLPLAQKNKCKDIEANTFNDVVVVMMSNIIAPLI